MLSEPLFQRVSEWHTQPGVSDAPKGQSGEGAETSRIFLNQKGTGEEEEVGRGIALLVENKLREC